MNEYQTVSTSDAPELLTVIEAAAILRIGRTTAYELAREFIRTAGESGLPVVRVGRQLRVPRDRIRAFLGANPVEQANGAVADAPAASAVSTTTLMRLFEV